PDSSWSAGSRRSARAVAMPDQWISARGSTPGRETAFAWQAARSTIPGPRGEVSRRGRGSRRHGTEFTQLSQWVWQVGSLKVVLPTSLVQGFSKAHAPQERIIGQMSRRAMSSRSGSVTVVIHLIRYPTGPGNGSPPILRKKSGIGPWSLVQGPWSPLSPAFPAPAAPGGPPFG